VAGLIAAVVLAALIIDCLVGRWFPRGRGPTVYRAGPDEPGATVIVMFPGFGGSAEAISRALGEQLQPGEVLVVCSYGRGQVDDAAIFAAAMAALDALKPARVQLVGGSMGGLIATRFLARYAHDMRHGPFALAFDTTPSGVDTVRVPRPLVMLTRWYRGSPLATLAVGLFNSAFGRRPEVETGASPALVHQADRQFAWAGTSALTGQARYLTNVSLTSDTTWTAATSTSVYLCGTGPTQDPLVRTDAAIADIRAVLPDLIVMPIATREMRWHLPWVRRPAETMNAVRSALYSSTADDT
jgi:pimeloyl-ACP methyl ester carboxylesterase